MDWMQIGAALLLLVMMIVFLWPRAKAMMEQNAQVRIFVTVDNLIQKSVQ